MKKIAFLIIVLIVNVSVMAQNPKNIKIVNANTFMEKGDKYVDKEEYEKAVQQYKKIPMGDSLYDLTQYRLALTYYYQELFDKAAVTLENILVNPSNSINLSAVYNLLSYVYMGNSQYDKAAKTIENALLLTPYNYRLLAALGKAYTELNIYDKAEDALKKSIFCYPKYQYSHNLLGKLYMKEDKTIPAILAYNYSACINPSSKDAIEALKSLNEMFIEFSELVDNISENQYITQKMKDDDERFQTLEQLVGNNIAMTKKFKLKTQIDHIITRQNQLVFEQLPQPLENKDILDYLYIPYFKSVMENDFNLFCYYELSGTNIDDNKVQKKALKLGKKIEVISYHFKKMLEEKAKYGIGIENTTKPLNEFSYNDEEGFIEGIGGYLKTDNGKKLLEGNWVIINGNGGIDAIVNTSDGVKNGVNYFYNDGYMEQKIPYLNDSIDGTGYLYFLSLNEQDRKTKLEVQFQNNKINGFRKEYNISGFLVEESEYKDGKMEGMSKLYYPQGSIKAIYHYENGNEIGLGNEYFENGAIRGEFENGSEDVEGKMKRYYPNGKLQVETGTMNKEYYGTAKSYYSNGKLETVGSYTGNGTPDGFWTDYFRNGNVSSEYSYENGVSNGEMKLYTLNGFLYAIFKFNKGKLEEITTFMPDNSIRKKTTINEGVFEVELYEENGLKFLSALYNDEGKSEGISTYYYPSGSILSTTPFKKGKIDGLKTTYFHNGNVESIKNYKNGVENGLFINYYNNDTIKEEGIYKEGELSGIHYNYYINGQLESVTVYQDGTIYSKTDYTLDGNTMTEIQYYKGSIKYIKNYDNNKNLIKTDTIENGNGILKTYFMNGSVSSEVKLVSNLKMDTMIMYDFQGKINNKIYYNNDIVFGKYFRNDLIYQVKKIEGNVVYNNFDGIVKHYHENGQINSEENYVLGILEGTIKYYDDNGKLSSIHHYIDDERESISTYYANDGKTIQYQLKYRRGDVIAIAYMTKNNKMSEMIPVGNDTIHFVSYYSDGKISCEMSFFKGQRVGKELFYYPNGKLSDDVTALYNDYNGSYFEYYSNGNKKLESNYYYNELNGPFIQYNENGTKKMEGNYVYSYPHGIFKLYDNKGVIVKEIEFYYGNIINQK
jgi:uncharacterized protein